MSFENRWELWILSQLLFIPLPNPSISFLSFPSSSCSQFAAGPLNLLHLFLFCLYLLLWHRAQLVYIYVPLSLFYYEVVLVVGVEEGAKRRKNEEEEEGKEHIDWKVCRGSVRDAETQTAQRTRGIKIGGVDHFWFMNIRGNILSRSGHLTHRTSNCAVARKKFTKSWAL